MKVRIKTKEGLLSLPNTVIGIDFVRHGEDERYNFHLFNLFGEIFSVKESDDRDYWIYLS